MTRNRQYAKEGAERKMEEASMQAESTSLVLVRVTPTVPVRVFSPKDCVFLQRPCYIECTTTIKYRLTRVSPINRWTCNLHTPFKNQPHHKHSKQRRSIQQHIYKLIFTFRSVLSPCFICEYIYPILNNWSVHGVFDQGEDKYFRDWVAYISALGTENNLS